MRVLRVPARTHILAHICATKQSRTKSFSTNIGTIPKNMLTNFELKRLKPKLDIAKKPENRVHELTDSNVSHILFVPTCTFLSYVHSPLGLICATINITFIQFIFTAHSRNCKTKMYDLRVSGAVFYLNKLFYNLVRAPRTLWHGHTATGSGIVGQVVRDKENCSASQASPT